MSEVSIVLKRNFRLGLKVYSKCYTERLKYVDGGLKAVLIIAGTREGICTSITLADISTRNPDQSLRKQNDAVSLSRKAIS